MLTYSIVVSIDPLDGRVIHWLDTRLDGVLIDSESFPENLQ